MPRALPVLALAGGLLAACTAPRPVVMGGDEGSVRISYAGNVAVTQPVAQHYCAQFDRVARFVQADPDSVYYDCERR